MIYNYTFEFSEDKESANIFELSQLSADELTSRIAEYDESDLLSYYTILVSELAVFRENNPIFDVSEQRKPILDNIYVLQRAIISRMAQD